MDYGIQSDRHQSWWVLFFPFFGLRVFSSSSTSDPDIWRRRTVTVLGKIVTSIPFYVHAIVGMGYRPTHSDPDITVISFKANEPGEWVERVNEFLDRECCIPLYIPNGIANESKLFIKFDLPAYHASSANDGYSECNYGTEAADKETPCSFKVELNKCADEYGFRANMPCIFLKPNKIFGWTPVSYTREEIESEDLAMPANLKTAILQLPTEVVRILNTHW